ncbi:DMT family transporter [Candidatus Parcubacteria bacterium]|nr:DMT family transporter [Candidatus Parcubacteria bacterium]
MELWILLGILSYLSYAISTSIDKCLMNHGWNPLVTNTVKMFFDGLILLIIGLIFFNLSFTSELLIYSLLLGFLYAFSGILYFKCLKYKDVGEVVPYLQSFTILLVFIGSIFLFSESVNSYNYIGILLIIIGVYLVLLKDGLKIPKIDKILFFIFLIVILNTGYILVVKSSLHNIEPINIAIMMYFSTTLVLLGFSIFHSKQKEIFKVKNLKIIPAAFFGALGTLFLYSALSIGNASKVYPLAGLESVFVFIIATIFLKEKFFLYRFIGTIIVFAGIYLICI